MLILLLTLIMFTRLDGHAVWIQPSSITMIQGADQLGYPTGTLINTSGGSIIVRQDVNGVVRALRDTPEK
jgi:uncharacterized protein YlzI (FlbEa/FlbD family)